ncbi:hypothetical protein MalM25_03200 [Planctomycetes bacterium MalM25]|nr:hypothetical protein MalM25_03200 [Planctomycetes bacterium MalM25]
MRFVLGLACALALLTAFSTPTPSVAYEVFATSIFSPVDPDPDPGLTGLLKIDTDTGVATTLVAESVGGLTSPTDVVFASDTNTVYVSTQNGYIWHYDATTGAPHDSLVVGQPTGVFALLPTAGFMDGVNSLLLDDDELLAATAFGAITPFDLATGAQQADLATGLVFPSGLSKTPGGAILASTGNPLGEIPTPGTIVQVANGMVTTLVDEMASPGVFPASNPTVVTPAADYDGDGVVTTADYDTWEALYASGNPLADGNRDGAVDAADYTLWRDSLGEEARILVTDLFTNQVVGFDLDGSAGAHFALIPPFPLPPEVDPTNSPSELLVSPEGTLLVSTLGPTRRPDNRGALHEFDRNGNHLRTIVDGLPALSGIALAPAAAPAVIPEPSTLLLASAAALFLGGRFRR